MLKNDFLIFDYTIKIYIFFNIIKNILKFIYFKFIQVFKIYIF